MISLPRLDEARDHNGRTIIESNRVMRVTTAINPGNSGGGLFNLRGELVGIIQARLFWADRSTNHPVDNIAYAIPLDVAFRVADQILDRFNGNNGNYENPIIAQKFDYRFNVITSSTVVNFKNGQMVISEVVRISDQLRPRRFWDGVELLMVTVVNKDGKESHYPISRAHQVDEIMIEGFGKTVRLTTTNGIVNL